ncbi:MULTISPECIES: BLUF domain-containing protein [Sphingobium]|uniref:BLUF domain-containing protein n=1 Tax=Sphingobium TaxID=165695 RepID=UPI001BED2385|nr:MULTISPECIES: BLUF domain-containing protein [Sphingobium]MBT2246419.1 BLUF domain-containing protein [Sphingobium sp. BHU LFT2]WBQ19022.1 BLUF domain-containing protein [Sphingobium yanoikuyae]
MKRLLYISTARAILPATELDELLLKSREANSRAGITGLLIVGGRRFLQVLEGADEAVFATYERIMRDPRHFALVKLHDKQVESRSFGTWDMGFEQLGIAPESTGGSLEDQVSAMVAPISDPTLRAYFTGFAKTHVRTCRTKAPEK